jgi:hypothetical protein
MNNKYLLALERHGSRRPLHLSGAPKLMVVVRNSASDALLGRADRLRRDNPRLSEEQAMNMTYGSPANRRLVLEERLGG